MGANSQSREGDGKAACTVESLALPAHSVCDAAASQRINGSAGELHLGEVFIPFHGPKAHADRHDCLPHERPKARGVAQTSCRQAREVRLETSPSTYF